MAAGVPGNRLRGASLDGAAELIFVGSPADVSDERLIVREVIEALGSDDRITRSLRAFMYEADFDRFTATSAPQDEVQEWLARASVLVCIFGERLGTPLPAEFVGSPIMPLRDLEPPVCHPWAPTDEAKGARALPLTGTVYEFLYARRSKKHLLVYIKGDETVLQRGAPAEERNLGLGRWYAELKGSLVRPSRKNQQEYAEQTEWLCRFIDEFALIRSRASFSLFKGSDELRSQLEKDLRLALGIEHSLLNVVGKGLDRYDVDDARQFHGRREEVLSLLAWHRDALRDPAQPNLVIVDGKSGVGKSSFLRAGLGAALRKGRSDLPAHVVCIANCADLVDPTVSPFVMFGRRLAIAYQQTRGHLPFDDADLARWEQHADTAGDEMLARIRAVEAPGAPAPLLLALDQFEQLLSDVERQEGGAAVSAHWESLLMSLRSLARQSLGLAVVSLSDDWSAALLTDARFAGLRAALGVHAHTERRPLHLPNPAHTEAIIRRFFDDRGVTVAMDLVTHLLKQVAELGAGGGSFLPLLSLVLARLYDAWRARTRNLEGEAVSVLDKASFEKDADLSSAINDLGERAYSDFTGPRRTSVLALGALPSLLRRMVWINAEDRRRSLRSIAAAEIPAEQLALLESLQMSRLAQNDGGVWQLVHETVVDHWKRARESYEKLHAEAVIVAALRPCARAWELRGKSPQLLLRESETFGNGITFTDVERMFCDWCDDLEPTVRNFVEESLYCNATSSPGVDRFGVQRLLWIAGSSSERLLRRYIALFPDQLEIPTRADIGGTALNVACVRPGAARVRVLLDAGADPNAATSEGHTPLQRAAFGGDAETCRLLLARGADPRIRHKRGEHALDLAVHAGHTEVAELLLSYEPALIDLRGPLERMPLMAAIGNGAPDLILSLLKHGADPRAKTPQGFHALDSAAELGRNAAVDVLLAADPTLVDLRGAEDRTALIVAAAFGHVALVRRLLAAGADARAAQSNGMRSLDVAAFEGRAEVIDVLLAHDPGLLTLPGARGRTALMAATAGGHSGVVKRLLRAGADATVQLSNGLRALDVAADRGSADIVDALLELDPTLVNLPGLDGRLPLVAAARQGYVAVVRRLLLGGADARAASANGNRALDASADSGHIEIVNLLIEHDPGLVDLPGLAGRTPLIAAAMRGRTAVVERLLRAGADPRASMKTGTRALDGAASTGRVEVVGALLAHDVSLLDERSARGRTALIASAVEGHVSVMMRLLAAGADPRARGAAKEHALSSAAEAGQLHTVRVLLDFDPTLINETGFFQRTALISAAAKGHLEVVRELLDRGADAALAAFDGGRALDVAATGRYVGIVDLLLERSAHLVNLPGRNGQSALLAATVSQSVDLVRRLLAAGADPNAQSNSGICAHHVAAYAGNTEVLELLLARGIQRDAISSEGKTALDYAREQGHEAAVALLATV